MMKLPIVDWRLRNGDYRMSKAVKSAVSRPTRIAAAYSVVLLHCCSHVLAQTASLPSSLDLSDPQVIASGATLFGKNCSVGYCHGSAGRAGRGPRLRGREWDKNYLFKVTYDGIPNSSMPAWKSRLTETEIGSIVAYILTLSKLTSDAVDHRRCSRRNTPIPWRNRRPVLLLRQCRLSPAGPVAWQAIQAKVRLCSSIPATTLTVAFATRSEVAGEKLDPI